MKQSSYTDEDGRKWAVWLEDDMADTEACMGLPLGPPPLESLGLPKETEIRLHNQLFDRGILTPRDAQRQFKEIFAAVQAAYQVDAARVLGAYLEQSSD